MNKRVKAVLMLAVWIFSIFNTFGLQVSGEEEAGVLSIKNNIIELLVSKAEGRFAVKTVEGAPERQEDENAPLLFLKDIPETTFTTFRIDGKDYIFGNAYSGIGGFVSSPITEGMKSTSTWKVGDITVTQQLELTDNIKSSDVGNVKISYSITNNGTKSSAVGTRILLDMMLGSNDGCKVSLDGESDIINETEAYGADIPVYWRCTDSVDNPKVVAYGFIKGWGNRSPDKMTIAHWSTLSTTKWDYSINPERNIGSSLNDYKSADSAVALYWDPETLDPGKTVKVETYYGLGNINQSTDGSTFNLNAVAPAKLSIEGDTYKDNPFDIMMELDNSIETSTELAGITAELVLPEGLEIVSGQESSRYFYRIPDNFKQTAGWKVKALDTQKLKVLQYMIRLTSMGKEIKNIKKYIIIPGFSKDDFDIGYTDVVPRNLYYNDENNAIQLIGYGFLKLTDKDSYDISMVNTSGSNTYYPDKTKDVAIVNDNQIRIGIPKGLETGKYKVVINHKDDLLDWTLTQEVTVTSEEKYKSRNYGILVIKEEDIGGKRIQSAKQYENESQLSAGDKSSAILILRGTVRSVSEGSFNVYGDTIAINNDIYYRGNVLSVYRSGNSYIVKGDGELYMETALLGKSMEITLKKGQFLIDTATALIEDEEGYINDISAIYVGYLPILVKDIKIQNGGGVNVDGVLKLENDYFKFLTGDVFDTDFIESDIKDMKITNKKIDIKAEFTVPFPRWKLGDFQSKDYATESKTDVTFFIDTVKGSYGFETEAQNLKLRLRDIDSTMAFDKNLYPDYFEFENEYGAIPEPIGNTGLAFESIGGGIYGLKSLIDSLRYGILPTGTSIEVRADIVDLLTYPEPARIKGKTMIGLLDMEAVLNSGGIDLKGDGYIYFVDVGDIVGHFDLSGGYIKADMNILDILISEAYFGINSHEIKGSISAKVQIPKKVWFIGGETIGGFKAGLSTSEIEGSIKFMGVGVGITYEWEDNDVDFDVGSSDRLYKSGIYTVDAKDAQGRDVTVTYGTNIEKVEDIGYSYEVCYAGDMGKTLALGASSYTYNVGIGESVESAIIELKYDSSGTPAIEVTDSDNEPYNLVDGVNYKNQIIPAAVSGSGAEEKRLFITIPSPKLGTWKVTSDQEVTMTLYNAKVPAAFESLSANQEAGKLKVDWALNETSGSKVALYLMREDGASESIELVRDLDVSRGVETYECDIPSGVTTGNYKVRAEVKRDGIGFDDMDSAAFEIVDAAAPVTPMGFTVKAAGNGMLEAEWGGVAGVDEYRIYAVDDKGNIDKTIETMVSVTGDKATATFGGTVKDKLGNETGWITGKTYRFALYAIKKAVIKDSEGKDIEIEHISKPAYSESVELPVPTPPEVTVGFTTEHGNINVENEVGYTNTGYINCSCESASDAEIIFYINGSQVAETEYKAGQETSNVQLDLKSGSNTIEIEAIGENGDKIKKAYEFYYDDKAPDLMVQSPGNNDTIKAGTVLVSGRTNAGCSLYVNGTQMKVAEDGSFNEEYMLSNMQRETVTIASVDLAGNRTEYSAEVYNPDAGNVVKVKAMPEIAQMRVGDSVQMRLYGVTADDKEVLLDADNVSWQLYDTDGAASMTGSGLLKAGKTGEIIINGQYSVSSDTTYEDALIINVLPEENSSNDDRDEDEDKDKDKDDFITLPENSTTGSLFKKSIEFKANNEIAIPGFMRLRFTGDEALPNGYIEAVEIKDLRQYRQQSGNKDFLSSIFDIKVPEGYQFNSPVELTIYFDKNKVKDLKHIAVYVYNEKTGIWDMLGGVVDEVNGSITLKVPHFSKYAVLENSGMMLMTDMNEHWARDAVYRLIDRGIVNGIKSTGGEYRFEPERTVTRAEFAKLLSLCEGYAQKDTDIDLSQFTDDAEIQPWVRTYMEYCSKKGWIKGKAVGKEVYIKPNDTITRAEAAAMISRALGFAAGDKDVKAEFGDKGKIPDWAAGYIDQLLEKKLMLGYSDNTFRPDKVLTRAEAAKIFDTYVSEKDKDL